MEPYYPSKALPRAFFWRRMQSFLGFLLILFLIEHLLTNSQATLYLGEDGGGFIRAVNNIRDLPYLIVIEIIFIALPFIIHMVWGVKYLFTAKPNSYHTSPKDPYLPHYSRNHAYTWQRITSWILLIAVAAHVYHMRFYYYPTSAKENGKVAYILPVEPDSDLKDLAKRLDVTFLEKNDLAKSNNKEWNTAVNSWNLNENEVLSLSPDFGTAELLLVRETFKSPLMIFLYSIFVLSATYHAFNGLWTFCITWGITLTERSQKLMRTFCTLGMIFVGFLGMMAIWGTLIMHFIQRGS